MGGGFPAGSIVHIFKTFNVRNISIIERKKQGIKGGKKHIGGCQVKMDLVHQKITISLIIRDWLFGIGYYLYFNYLNTVLLRNLIS